MDKKTSQLFFYILLGLIILEFISFYYFKPKIFFEACIVNQEAVELCLFSYILPIFYTPFFFIAIISILSILFIFAFLKSVKKNSVKEFDRLSIILVIIHFIFSIQIFI